MKKRSLILTLLVAFIVTCIMAVGCSAPPASVELNQDSVSVTERYTVQLEAKVENYTGDLEWTSSNTDVATVDSNGLVKGIVPGTATITVKAGIAKDTCEVVVTQDLYYPVLTVERSIIDLYPNGSINIGAKVTSNAVDKTSETTFTYTSNNPNVVTVDENGVVTGVAQGSTTVRVVAIYNNIQVETNVTVNVNLDLTVNLDVEELTLATGDVLENGHIGQQSVNLTVKLNEVEADITDVVWTSEQDSIATVVGNGKQATIKAEDAGSTKVIVNFKYEGVALSSYVDVNCYMPEYEIIGKFYVDASEKVDSKQAINLPEGIDGSNAVKVFLGDNELAIVSKTATQVVVDSAIENGETAIKVQVGKTIYKYNALVATMVLSTKDDVLEFAKNYSAHIATDLFVLAANIDMEGTQITNAAGSTWTNSYSWTATFDGQGYALSNISFTHGLFPNFTSGTVKNLALINAEKAVNGGGLIANTCNGTITNCFIMGTIATGSSNGASQAGIAYAAYNNANITNNVVVLTYTAGGTYAISGAPSSATAIIKDNVVISTVTNLFGRDMTNATGNKAYTSVNGYVNDASKPVVEYDALWTTEYGLPMLSNSIPAINAYASNLAITNTNTLLANGDVVAANYSYVDYSLKTAVEGISIDAVTGKVTIADSVEDKTKFTVVATLFGKYTAEKEFSANVLVDATAHTIAVSSVSQANTFDISKIDPSYTDASKVSSLTYNGDNVSFEIDGSNIIIDGNAFAGYNFGAGKAIMTINGIKHQVSLQYATFVINNLDDLKTFFSTYNTANAKGELYILNADIDAAGFDFGTLYDNSTRYSAQSWLATFDGLGHSISNAKFYCGFFPQINGYPQTNATVKNLALINPVDTFVATATQPCGFMSRRSLNGGKIENCYVKGEIQGPYYTGFFGMNGPAATGHESCEIINCLVDLTVAEGAVAGNIGAYAVDAAYSCGKYTCAYAIGDIDIIGQMSYGVKTNCSIYADAQALIADTADTGAMAKLNGQGYWTVKDGALYFGAIKVA